MQYRNFLKKNILFLFLIFVMSLPFSVQGQSVSELEQEIANYNIEIQKLEKEIAEQRLKVEDTSKKAASLQSVVNSLNATQKKLDAEISRTRNVIGKTETNIEKISIEIVDKRNKIEITNGALSEAVRALNVLEDRSIFEMIFSSRTISDFTKDLVNIQKIKKTLGKKKVELINLNEELFTKKTESETEKENLEEERLKLVGQRESVEYTKKEKDSLLAVTKNQEANYKAVLAKKEAQKKEFQDTLLEIESKLNILVDPGSYPSAIKGLLGWPLDSIYVTQQFGGTQFAKTNPGVYSRPFHPGADFGTPIGSQVRTISDGVIKGVGNTDAYPGCYAWGKFILVEHDNGLSSLYAHLSSILRSPGERVTQGTVIGLSGNTGVSTGPHLHLGLYATQGVFVGKYAAQKKSATGCASTDATGVFADLDAYLDPLSYLP